MRILTQIQTPTAIPLMKKGNRHPESRTEIFPSTEMMALKRKTKMPKSRRVMENRITSVKKATELFQKLIRPQEEEMTPRRTITLMRTRAKTSTKKMIMPMMAQKVTMTLAEANRAMTMTMRTRTTKIMMTSG